MGSRSPAGVGYPTLAEIRANPVVNRVGEKVLTELALDLSSACVGWAVGSNKKLQRYGKFVFKSTAGVGAKYVSFEDFLETLIETHWPERLLIEKPATRFGNTTLRHTELLGIARKVWADKTGGKDVLDAWLIAATTVKRVMNVRRGRNHEENKIIMVNKINTLYGLNLTFDRNSKIKTGDDVADAIAVLTTYWRKGVGTE